MYKLRNLLGLPVLESKSGIQIGEVQEAILDIEKVTVRGIIVANASWFTQDQGVMLDDLYRIGPDAVMVRDSQVVRELSDVLNSNNVFRFRDLAEKQIFTETGQCLGSLVDIIYDHITGEIKAYEVSDGLLTDLLYGRMVMPLPQAQAIGEDKVIVPEAMAKLIHTEK